jgi:uncharacterized RDD family membrane protein YckC
VIDSTKKISFLKRIIIVAYDLILVFTALFFAAAVAFAIQQGSVSHHWWYPFYLGSTIALFYIWFWKKGETLGLRAWGIRVVKLDGTRLGWQAASLRFVTGLLCLASLGLGFVWILFDKENRTWNDILSKTKLVYRD